MFAEEFVILLFTCSAYTVHAMIIFCSLMGWEQQNNKENNNNNNNLKIFFPINFYGFSVQRKLYNNMYE